MSAASEFFTGDYKVYRAGQLQPPPCSTASSGADPPMPNPVHLRAGVDEVRELDEGFVSPMPLKGADHAAFEFLGRRCQRALTRQGSGKRRN